VSVDSLTVRDDAGGTDRPTTWDVADDVGVLAPAWRALEAEGVAPPFQGFDWVAAWIASGAGDGETMLVTVRRGERLDAVLPFEILRIGPVRIAHWLSGRHAGYGFGLWRRGVPFPAEEIVAGLGRVGRSRRIDLFVLDDMPLDWDGTGNPLATVLTTQPALDDGHYFHLAPSFDALLAGRNAGHKRKKIRAKEKMLAALGDYRVATTTNDVEARRALDAFFAQKAASLGRLGIADPFASDAVRTFYTTLATGERPLLELTRLEAGGAIRAVLGSVVTGRSSLQLFVSAARDETVRASPGETLFHRHIEQACARGLGLYDMGLGAERYKASWCDRTLPLVSAVHPLTLLGRLAGCLFRLTRRLKARIRRDERLWARVRRLRARLIGRGTGESESH